MSVAFPIALATSTLGCDVLYWWSGDPFWTRAALWAIGAAFFFGLFAAVSGTVELLVVHGIRKHPAAWSHAVVALMLLAVMGLNWGVRLSDPEGAVLPLGLMLSALGGFFVAIAGWHGGKLVFDHGVGTAASNKD